jgi:thiol-disulfide isomerase/thioredoxin
MYLQGQVFYSPALLRAINEIKDKYPNSTNIKHFEPQIDKLKSYLETHGHDGIKIIDQEYNSFAALIKEFEGRNILIDVWATWCAPCIQEFKHKEILQPFINNKSLDVLYISVDKPALEERWKKAVQFNELLGSHYRADVKFKEDMWNVVGGLKYGIPRYILVNKSGKIFKHTAARPSEGPLLLAEIQQLVNNE